MFSWLPHVMLTRQANTSGNLKKLKTLSGC
jgi:hypothetical protein